MLPGARQLLTWRLPTRWRRRALSWRQRSARPRCFALGRALTRTAPWQASRCPYVLLVLSMQSCNVSKGHGGPILSLQTSQSPCHGQFQQCRYPVCNISCGMQ